VCKILKFKIINNNFTNHAGSKIENNLMNYGNIDEEDDEKNSNNNIGINNTNFHCREAKEIKLDTIKIENKANFKLEKNKLLIRL